MFSIKIRRVHQSRERRGPRSRAEPSRRCRASASVAAVACAPAEGRWLRLARPGRSRANVIETLDDIDLKPKYELEYLTSVVPPSSVKVIAI